MNCRDCRRRIDFVLIPATGRRIPIDPTPDRAGNVAATYGTAGGLVGRVLSKAQPGPEGEEHLYMPHKATCPAVRRKPRPEPPPTLFDGAGPAAHADAKQPRRLTTENESES